VFAFYIIIDRHTNIHTYMYVYIYNIYMYIYFYICMYVNGVCGMIHNTSESHKDA